MQFEQRIDIIRKKLGSGWSLDVQERVDLLIRLEEHDKCMKDVCHYNRKDKPMNSDRETQFQGFAKLLWDELENHPYVELGRLEDCDREQLYRVIARRAYDLVDIAICHIAMEMSNDSAVMFVPRKNAVNYIPDITKWPQDQKCPDTH